MKNAWRWLLGLAGGLALAGVGRGQILSAVERGQILSAVDTNAPPLTLRGMVFDTNGAPLSGVLVAVASGLGTNEEARSGADGRYAVVWREFNLNTTVTPTVYARDLERNLAVSQDFTARTTNLDLHLLPGLTLAVKALDAKGEPIATATETLSVLSGNKSFRLDPKPSKADNHGLIEVKGLPPGLRYAATISANGYSWTNCIAGEGLSKPGRLELPAVVLRVADRQLAGVVLGADGKPAAAAEVRIQGNGQVATNTTTDDEGRFLFDAVCAGPVMLNASTRNRPPRRITCRAARGRRAGRRMWWCGSGFWRRRWRVAVA